MKPLKVDILVFDDVEVLDFAGPFEVFAVTGQLNTPPSFEVAVVGSEIREFKAVNGLKVVPNLAFDDERETDILVLPGGSGTSREMNSKLTQKWISKKVQQAQIVLSVCSGARFLAKLGLLYKMEATTHKGVLDNLLQIDPTIMLRPDKRFVDTGKIITTGGISAGIDGSFHVVQRVYGDETASRTAAYMEYNWTSE